MNRRASTAPSATSGRSISRRSTPIARSAARQPPRRSAASTICARRCGSRLSLGARHLLAGESGPRGCFLIGTAATEAVGDKICARDLRCRAARARTTPSPCASAWRGSAASRRRCRPRPSWRRLASAVLHTLSLRARAGETREALEKDGRGGGGPALRRGVKLREKTLEPRGHEGCNRLRCVASSYSADPGIGCKGAS